MDWAVRLDMSDAMNLKILRSYIFSVSSHGRNYNQRLSLYLPLSYIYTIPSIYKKIF